jgi:hypothetical protein
VHNDLSDDAIELGWRQRQIEGARVGTRERQQRFREIGDALGFRLNVAQPAP